MREFNYLTGRKELFDNAPPEAMVVLETNDGQIYYAVSHNRGAQYWYDNGNPGRPIGLIALFEKTRVIASRVRADGLPPAEPKRDPIPKSRLDRMEQAQKTLRKAVSQPAPVKPKPEPAPPKVEPKKANVERQADQHLVETALRTAGGRCQKCGLQGIHACPGKPFKWEPQDKQRLNEAVKQIIADEQKPKVEQGGFVSIFAMSRTTGTPCAFLNLHRNGNISLSTKLPIVTGDVVDVQVDPARGLIRVGKAETGGRALPKSRMLTSKALVDTFRIPEGNNSIRIYLTDTDGWWQGSAEVKS